MSNPSFPVDYDVAKPYWAHPSNYRTTGTNHPRGFVLHTPEEPADSNPYTPVFFADPNRDASTHYFAAYSGIVYQCVPERYLAIANGVKGKPYPAWADPSVSLNWQSLSVEIEGYAESIGDTLVVGGAQWRGLVDLIRERCAAWDIPLDREHIIGHYQVADDRTDPGATFPWDALIAELQGGRMYTDAEIDAKIGEALALGVRTQTNLNELANGIDAVSVANKWPLSLKGLWWVAGKAWPF